MLRNLSSCSVALLAAVVLVSSARAEDAKKHVFVPPVNVTQALKINMETKATEPLLKKMDEQCVDAACHQQVDACRKVVASCLIVPSKASVEEQEHENN